MPGFKENTRRISGAVQAIANLYLENQVGVKRQEKQFPKGAKESEKLKAHRARYINLAVTLLCYQALTETYDLPPAKIADEALKETETRIKSKKLIGAFPELFGPQGIIDKLSRGDAEKKISLLRQLHSSTGTLARLYVDAFVKVSAKDKKKALVVFVRHLYRAFIQVFQVPYESLEPFVVAQLKNKTASELNSKEFRDRFSKDFLAKVRSPK